jgi:hypothetical protein
MKNAEKSGVGCIPADSALVVARPQFSGSQFFKNFPIWPKTNSRMKYPG